MPHSRNITFSNSLATSNFSGWYFREPYWAEPDFSSHSEKPSHCPRVTCIQQNVPKIFIPDDGAFLSHIIQLFLRIFSIFPQLYFFCFCNKAPEAIILDRDKNGYHANPSRSPVKQVLVINYIFISRSKHHSSVPPRQWKRSAPRIYNTLTLLHIFQFPFKYSFLTASPSSIPLCVRIRFCYSSLWPG